MFEARERERTNARGMTVRSMTVGQKASLSLLFAVLVFAAFAVAAFSGLFDLVESRFYNPTVARSYEKTLDEAAKASDAYHSLNLERFRAVLGTDAVKRSFLPNMGAQDAFDRANAFGKLQEETPGLTGLRLVDAAGKRIHFSTFRTDIQRQTDTETIYRNYGDSGDRPYEELASAEATGGRIILDPEGNRFVYSLPFSDSFGVYRGSALFYVSQSGLVSSLLRSGLMALGDEAILAADQGVILKVPIAGKDALAAHIAGLWRDGLSRDPLTITEASGTSSSLVLFSRKTASAGALGMVVPSSSFVFPASMKWLLLGSFFITAYLLAFLILNLRQDRMTVLSDRIKRFQINLLEGYLANKADIDFERWSRELEARRGEVKVEFKRSMGIKRKAADSEVDALVDKSWDEILAILGKKAEAEALPSGVSVKEVERLIAEAIRKGNFVLPPQVVEVQAPSVARLPSVAPATVAAVPAPRPVPSPASRETEELEEAEAVEEVEDLEEAEAVEEAEDLEEAEAVEEVEDLEEAEAVEEAAEPEEAEAVEEAAEPEEAEAVEEAAEPAEAETLEEIEELEEAGAVAAPATEGEAGQSAYLRPPEPLSTLEPDALEELEPVEEELEPVDEEPAFGDMRAVAAQALALASDTDDIPLIPESSGLELADESDIADIIGFIEIDEVGLAGDLDFAAPSEFGSSATEEVAELEEIAEPVAEGAAIRDVEEAQDLEDFGDLEPMEAEQPVAPGPGQGGTGARPSAPAPERSISLGSLDLSALAAWQEGPAGAEEMDATRSGHVVAESPVVEDLLPVEALAGPAGEAEEPTGARAETQPVELPLVSDEQMERLEALPVFEPSDSSGEEAKNLLPLTGDRYVYFSPDRYAAAAAFTSTVILGELPLADDDEETRPSPDPEAGSPRPACADGRVDPDEECDGPIVWKNGLWQVDREGERLPVELDPALKRLADSVLSTDPGTEGGNSLRP